MTKPPIERSLRSHWTDVLLILLDRSEPAPRHADLARLLQLFASDADASRLEAIIVDRARDPWVRTYVLRALRRHAIAITQPGIAMLQAEFAAELPASRKRGSPWRFANIENVADLTAVASGHAGELTQAPRRPAPEQSLARQLLSIPGAPPDEPLLHLVALGLAAAAGDDAATAELARTAREAPHVVLRAYSLRALRQAIRRPDGYVALCRDALQNDHETFERFYAPVTSEAALGLSRHPEVPATLSLELLVQAALDLRSDDTWWALEYSICSWIHGDDRDINPLWYRAYLA